jgi:hypothetical protein
MYCSIFISLFPIPEEGAIIVLARQHHKNFNVSYEATINLVYNLTKQNMIRNLKQQWIRYMFHKCLLSTIKNPTVYEAVFLNKKSSTTKNFKLLLFVPVSTVLRIFVNNHQPKNKIK